MDTFRDMDINFSQALIVIFTKKKYYREIYHTKVTVREITWKIRNFQILKIAMTLQYEKTPPYDSH